MRYRVLSSRRAGAGTLVCLLAVGLVIAAGSGRAVANEDDDAAWDVKAMRQLFKDLGLQRDGGQIEYRERAPLVVPPSRNLPPPASAESVAENPAWPKDPDAAQQKLLNAKKKSSRAASDVMETESRPLPRSELEKGRIAAGAGSAKAAPTAEESARPMRPAELGSKGISSWFSFGRKTETATFTEEPERDSLTAPPPGYRTPSPNQPYGVGPSNERGKAIKYEDRMTTYSR